MQVALTDDDMVFIVACGLSHILFMPSYWKNKALLSALAERWHSDHNTFHFPNGEIIVTPEDVYKILWILITGEIVQYDVEEQCRTTALREVFAVPQLSGYSVAW